MLAMFDFHYISRMETTLNYQRSLFTWPLKCEKGLDFRRCAEAVILWEQPLLQEQKEGFLPFSKPLLRKCHNRKCQENGLLGDSNYQSEIRTIM